MQISGTTAWRAVSALTVATLAAGLLGGLRGAPECARVTPASTASSAAPGGTSADRGRAAAGSPAGGAQAALAAAVAPLVADRPAGSVSIAALDTSTGTRIDWGAGSGMTTASVFKLLLLEGYLLQGQDRGQAPGDGASAELSAMIENSDNDAADQVYAALGGRAGVVSALARLGMSATVADPDDHWGLSTTGADDQLAALRNLVSPHSPLSSASRTYALGLMSHVESDQRWGVGVAADRGTDFANKNGWLDVDDDDGRWAVGSVGVVQVGGHPVLLAVLTQHDADLCDGIGLVESLSGAAAGTLRRADASRR